MTISEARLDPKLIIRLKKGSAQFSIIEFSLVDRGSKKKKPNESLSRNSYDIFVSKSEV